MYPILLLPQCPWRVAFTLFSLSNEVTVLLLATKVYIKLQLFNKSSILIPFHSKLRKLENFKHNRTSYCSQNKIGLNFNFLRTHE